MHLRSCIGVNFVLWVIWWLSSADHTLKDAWVLYLSGLWSIGLLLDFIKTYTANSHDLVKREYEKLSREQNL